MIKTRKQPESGVGQINFLSPKTSRSFAKKLADWIRKNLGAKEKV